MPKNAPQSARSCRIGLAIGGGLPFGLIALGVLRAFEEEELPIERMAGTSMGSIIAATWAAGYSIDECVVRFKDAFSRKRMLSLLLRDLSFSPSGLLRGSEIVNTLDTLLGKGRRFEDLRVPLRIPACDLSDGSEVVFESGPLVPAIRASISLPGIFTPFRYEGRVLVDGALIRPIPVHLLHDDEVDLKIPVRAVRRRGPTQLRDDISDNRRRHRVASLLARKPENLFDVVWKSLSLIMQDEFSEMIFDDYDIYIRPELDLALSRDPSRVDEIVEAGYVEAQRMMPKIREAAYAGVARTRTSRPNHDPLGEALESETGE